MHVEDDEIESELSHISNRLRVILDLLVTSRQAKHPLENPCVGGSSPPLGTTFAN
jgi:hypothetical protein